MISWLAEVDENRVFVSVIHSQRSATELNCYPLGGGVSARRIGSLEELPERFEDRILTIISISPRLEV